MTGADVFKRFGFVDPDRVGSSEYRAVYDLLADAFDTGDHPYEDEYADEPSLLASVILEEVIKYAENMLQSIADIDGEEFDENTVGESGGGNVY